jgi:hypothetical protein
VSDCELTDTYSPAAIDMAPATSPAIPATKTSCCVAAAAATPTIRLAVERMPSSEHRGSQPPGAVDEVALRGLAKPAHSDVPPCQIKAAQAA